MSEMSESSRWENELAQFYKVLENPKRQAIVIVGPAGSGKSTLLSMMVMIAKKFERLMCEGNIYRVGPNDNPINILREIGRWPSGTVTKFQAKTILERLRESVEEYGDLHRRVVGIDAKPTMATKFEQWWMEIIPKLPEKVSFIFTQRPDGILATNKQFMNLPNVVRIDLKTVFLSDDKSEGKFKEDENKTIEEELNKPEVTFKAKKPEKEKAQKQEATFDKQKNDEENLKNAFIEFLKKEKHYSEDCIEEIIKEDPQIDLCLVNIETSKALFVS